jgi:hypothetical protein
VHLGSPSHSRPALKSCSVLECRSCGSRPPAARPRRAARDAPVGLFAEVLFIESSRSPTNWDCGIEAAFRSQGDEWVQHCLATLGARTATVLTKRRPISKRPCPSFGKSRTSFLSRSPFCRMPSASHRLRYLSFCAPRKYVRPRMPIVADRSAAE